MSDCINAPPSVRRHFCASDVWFTGNTWQLQRCPFQEIRGLNVACLCCDRKTLLTCFFLGGKQGRDPVLKAQVWFFKRLCRQSCERCVPAPRTISLSLSAGENPGWNTRMRPFVYMCVSLRVCILCLRACTYTKETGGGRRSKEKLNVLKLIPSVSCCQG